MEIDQAILIELIKAGGNILTATIPSVVSFYIGRKIMASKELKEKYRTAMNDIMYLLELEKKHCREHKETSGSTKRQSMRDAVKNETALEWSGKFTPSQIVRRIAKIN